VGVSSCVNVSDVKSALSSAQLQKLINQYDGKWLTTGERKQSAQQVVEQIFTKPMKPAVYFSVADVEEEKLWRHYALNFSHYTHFTSPIRRYADVLVHRLLSVSLKEDPMTWEGTVASAQINYRHSPLSTKNRALASAEAPEAPEAKCSKTKNTEEKRKKKGAPPKIREGALFIEDDPDVAAVKGPSGSFVSRQCERCNQRKENAKSASQMSGKAFLCRFLDNLKSNSDEDFANRARTTVGTVMGIGTGSFDVYVPMLGKEYRVFCNDMADKHCLYVPEGKQRDSALKYEVKILKAEISQAGEDGGAGDVTSMQTKCISIEYERRPRLPPSEEDEDQRESVTVTSSLVLFDVVRVEMMVSTSVPVEPKLRLACDLDSF
jgi:exoribonuclease R